MTGQSLYITNVVQTFGGVRALDLANSAIAFAPGQITAVLGGNGAGKTTLLNIIHGVLEPDAGRVCWGDVDITSTPLHRRARLGIARLWQDLRLFPQLSCRENVEVAIPGLRS